MKRRVVVGAVNALVGCLFVSCGNGPSGGADSEPAVTSSVEAGRTLAGLRGRNGSLLPAGVARTFRRSENRLRPEFTSTADKPPARVLLPARSNQPIRLEDLTTGMLVDVTLRDASDAPAEVSDGYVVFARGHATGATVLHRPMPEGIEDYLSFEGRPAASSIAYDVVLGHGVSGLRVVGETVEMLDAHGTPRLRMAPPYLIGADGMQTDAKVVVEGCAVDRNPAPPWGRAVTAPGGSRCLVRVSWEEAGVAYPALLDPRWTTTGSMGTARQDHTMVLLPTTGKVLVAGGRSTSSTQTGLSTAELFDRATATWSPTGSMTGARFSHSATLLNSSSNSTTSGKVLIAGGFSGGVSVATAQLFSPAAGTWIAAGSLSSGRHLHSATLLSNGNVLVAGGINGTTTLASAAIYNPSMGAGSWTNVATNMSSARRFHTATLLSSTNANFSDRVLIAGGNNGTASLGTAQLFNSSNSSWSNTTALPGPREGHTATALSGGKVLLTGGKNGGTTLSSTLVFTIPASGMTATWPSGGNMTSARTAHTATLLSSSAVANGQVLVVGGLNGGTLLGTAELWNGVSAWVGTTAPPSAIQGHTAVRLASNTVLVAGGNNGSGTVSASRIYDPSFALACTSNSQCAGGFCANGVCCDTACTNQCFACNLPNSVGTCSPRATGSGCDDGNACTQTDYCQAGGCVGSNVKSCPAADQCRPSNVCNPATGACPVAAAGTSCSDGNVCNGAETCDGNGICRAGTPRVCVASAGCVGAATCDPMLGCQAGPAQGGQTCTVSDACATPSNCTSSVNVTDPTAGPTPTMEDHCWRLRDIPVRFIDYNDGTSPLDDPNNPTYIPALINALNETYAKTCMTFHARTHYVVPGSKFSSYGNYNPTNKQWTPTFNWAADGAEWSSAVPHNWSCAFNVPSLDQDEFTYYALLHIFNACGLPDELNVLSQQTTPVAGVSGYPSRVVWAQNGTRPVHEVGHNFSLQHVFEPFTNGRKPSGTNFTVVPQTLADSWDLIYAQGNPTNMNRFFISYDDAHAAEIANQPIKQFLDTQFSGNPNALGIYLPGTYTDSSTVPPTTYNYQLPPKTGPNSCATPPDGLGPCVARDFTMLAEPSFSFCFNCEYIRMYEAWNGAGSFPPPGPPRSLVFSPGQALYEWRMNGTFNPGFAGFVVETGGGLGGPPMAGFAPKRTKLQALDDPNKRTTQVMSYGVGYRTFGDGTSDRSSGWAPVFEALSDSQAVLVRNTLKADVRNDAAGDPIDQFNLHKFGRYPARGSWEKIGQNLAVDASPMVVPTDDGVLITAVSSTGQVVFRHWTYGDAPWASQSRTATVINGPAWSPVLPAQPRSVSGRVTGGYRQSDGVFDIAIHQASGGVDDVERVTVRANNTGLKGWESIPAGIRGAPLMLTRPGPEGARLDLLVLGTGQSANYFFINEWSRTGPSWTGWFNLDSLANVPNDGFDASVRPDGTIDLVAVTADGRYRNAVINSTNLGFWDWGDLGNPNPALLPGLRPSVAQMFDATSHPESHPFQGVEPKG